ncbi:hypothetical protein CUR86_03005 [Salinicola acroporae]|uniref:Secreted protein n=1 Tax=Salinicola acroporae TaxID=1541440 RepID=A0ABT6I2I8_9GAMM|nr:hypothetical protein [Salinicola acroporae]
MQFWTLFFTCTLAVQRFLGLAPLYDAYCQFFHHSHSDFRMKSRPCNAVVGRQGSLESILGVDRDLEGPAGGDP